MYPVRPTTHAEVEDTMSHEPAGHPVEDLPGSPGKFQTLAYRAGKRQALHHPGDAGRKLA